MNPIMRENFPWRSRPDGFPIPLAQTPRKNTVRDSPKIFKFFKNLRTSRKTLTEAPSVSDKNPLSGQRMDKRRTTSENRFSVSAQCRHVSKLICLVLVCYCMIVLIARRRREILRISRRRRLGIVVLGRRKITQIPPTVSKISSKFSACGGPLKLDRPALSSGFRAKNRKIQLLGYDFILFIGVF